MKSILLNMTATTDTDIAALRKLETYVRNAAYHRAADLTAFLLETKADPATIIRETLDYTSVPGEDLSPEVQQAVYDLVPRWLDQMTVKQRDAAAEQHTLTTTPDSQYPHLVYGACACGDWSTSGAAKLFVVEEWHQRHAPRG